MSGPSLARCVAMLCARPGSRFARCTLAALLWVTAADAQAQWTSRDVGTVAAVGSARIDGGTFTVTGSGADIWSVADAFQFYSQPLSGDGTITARITGITDTNGWAKAGVMIRESLEPGARNIFLAATPEWHGIIAQERSSAAGVTTLAAGPAVSVPYWLRLTRTGSLFTAATSPDGVAWTNVATWTLSLPTTAYFGLAVTSHNDGTSCTATFDYVSALASISQPANPPAAPSNLAATAVTSSQIRLNWTDNANTEDGFEIERSTDNATFARVATAGAAFTNYTDSGLNSSTTYYYRIRAVNSAGASSYTNIASATTTAPAPPPTGSWLSADIGTATAGQTSASGAAVTLTGSGRDIWNTADGFRYYYQAIPTGDCEIIVRVASLTNTNGWAKAGLMFRQSLEPGSPHAWACVSAEHGVAFQSRATANGETSSSTPSEDGPPPRWLKLVCNERSPYPRRVTAYVSTDGLAWTVIGGLGESMRWSYVGLAVTSHNDGALCAAQFDHLALLTAPASPTDLRVIHRGPDGEIDLAWTNVATDVDRLEIQELPPYRDATYSTVAIVSGTTTQFAAHLSPGENGMFRVLAFRDLAGSQDTYGISTLATIGAYLYRTGATTSSLDLRWDEPAVNRNGPQRGPWSLERSADGVTFREIAGGLTGTENSGYSTTYTDAGLATATRYYYRVRQLFPNGDCSAYSAVLAVSTSGGTPAAPTGLVANATSATSVQLDWTDNATTESGYSLERSTDGTTFGFLRSLAADTTRYTDTTVIAGATYYYRIRAVLNSDFSAYSNTATASTPSEPTVLAWTPRDIGSVGARGSTSESGTTVTVSGSGADIWSEVDAFHFAYQTLNGDGAIIARVASITDTNGWAKAGLMFRSSLEPNAYNVLVAVTPEWHGIVAQARGQSASVETRLTSGPVVNAPYWLKLVRTGGSFTASTSADGVNWTAFATFTPYMNATAYVGLAVTSHNDGTLCSAVFDHVSVTRDSSSAPTITSVTPPVAASNGYGIGSTLQFTVNFSAAVSVIGSPYIGLTIGVADRQAAYVSGSGSSSLVFRYTVASGDLDTDGITMTSAINLHGGSIRSASGVDASVIFTRPDTSRVYVYGVPPPKPRLVGVTNGTVSADGTSATTTMDGYVSGYPTFTGTAQVRSYVYLYLGSTPGPDALPMGSAQADANGNWSVTYGGQALGPGHTYAFSLVSSDGAGNSSSPAAFSLTTVAPADRRTPAVSPATVSGQVGTAIAPVQISATNSPTGISVPGLGSWGLSVSSSGLITGTPTATANGTTLTIYATNSYGYDQGTLTLNIAPATGSGGGSTSNWSVADIGAVGASGSDTASGNTITISGAGADIWGTADSFRFVWKTWTGDGVVEAQVSSMGNTDGWAKAGVMIRESAEPGARNVFVALTPTWHGIVAQSRATAGGDTTQVAGPSANAPYWVKITRTGNTFVAATSLNGTTWTTLTTFSVPMNTTACFGFAVTSHNPAQLNTAVFTDPFIGAGP